MRLRIYLAVLRTPSVTRLLSSAVVGRMPTGMAGLAIVLLVRGAGGSYAVAGVVAGTYSAALALTSPLLGRLVDRVDLEIRDDGVGFDPLATSTSVSDGHLGLAAMQERVEMAGGRFQVDTSPGAGVVVRAMFQVPAPS